jgi:hypothetical protein
MGGPRDGYLPGAREDVQAANAPDPLPALRAALVQALMGKGASQVATPTADPWVLARRVVEGASSKDALGRLHRALTVESPDPLYAFFQRDPLLAGDASWQKRMALLDQIEQAADLPRALPPDFARPKDPVEHLDAEPGGDARVGDVVGPNVVLDIVRGTAGVGLRFVNVQTGSSVMARPVALRALQTARGTAASTPLYRGLGGRLTTLEWRALWPDPAGGILVRYEAAKLTLEDDLLLDVHRGVLTRYALRRLEENERALAKLLADAPELARTQAQARLLRDAIAIRDALEARLAAGDKPGLVPASGPTRADLEAASATWSTAFGDLPRPRSAELKPEGLSAALVRLRSDLGAARVRLVDEKQQAGDLDPWTIDAVRTLADPTLLPRARAVVTARRGAATAAPADARPELFLAPDTFLDAAVGMAAGVASIPLASVIGHLINATFEASCLRLLAIAGKDREVVRRVVGAVLGKPPSAIPLFAAHAGRPRSAGKGGAAVQVDVLPVGPEVPKESSGIPDDEATLPGVAWPAVRDKNREVWKVLGLIKAPPIRGFDPYYQPKGFANRVYRAQAALRQGGITQIEGAALVADGVLGPRTLMALARAARDDKFPTRDELAGLAVDFDALRGRGVDDEQIRAFVAIHPSNVLVSWRSRVKGENAVQQYERRFASAAGDAEMLDRLFFGEDVPPGILWLDRKTLLERVYGRSGRELDASLAVVAIDVQRDLYVPDFDRVAAGTAKDGAASIYFRFGATDRDRYVVLRDTFVRREEADAAVDKLPREKREQVADALAKFLTDKERERLHPKAPPPAGVGFMVLAFLPEITDAERATIVRPYLKEKAEREEAERQAKIAQDKASAKDRADAIVALVDDDEMYHVERLVRLEGALHDVPHELGDLVIEDLEARTPNRLDSCGSSSTSSTIRRAPPARSAPCWSWCCPRGAAMTPGSRPRSPRRTRSFRDTARTPTWAAATRTCSSTASTGSAAGTSQPTSRGSRTSTRSTHPACGSNPTRSGGSTRAWRPSPRRTSPGSRRGSSPTAPGRSSARSSSRRRGRRRDSRRRTTRRR